MRPLKNIMTKGEVFREGRGVDELIVPQKVEIQGRREQVTCPKRASAEHTEKDSSGSTRLSYSCQHYTLSAYPASHTQCPATPTSATPTGGHTQVFSSIAVASVNMRCDKMRAKEAATHPRGLGIKS
ncbi:hypothetical protein E2C01_007038 [Portunus trituberculatus]|uniref:Uncharacterized protein n=1 Tax=Portunus trituberculatus TaxID=210409 RepID=A0A5B7CYY9_PORTR|nr:hypothetical protein [Portunus trituberculatus]